MRAIAKQDGSLKQRAEGNRSLTDFANPTAARNHASTSEAVNPPGEDERTGHPMSCLLGCVRAGVIVRH